MVSIVGTHYAIALPCKPTHSEFIRETKGAHQSAHQFSSEYLVSNCLDIFYRISTSIIKKNCSPYRVELKGMICLGVTRYGVTHILRFDIIRR